MVERGDTAADTVVNMRLRQAIHVGSGNDFLHKSIVEIRQRLAAYRPVAFERPGRMKASHREHRAIVDSIVRGDEIDAHEAMHANLLGGCPVEHISRQALDVLGV